MHVISREFSMHGCDFSCNKYLERVGKHFDSVRFDVVESQIQNGDSAANILNVYDEHAHKIFSLKKPYKYSDCWRKNHRITLRRLAIISDPLSVILL